MYGNNGGTGGLVALAATGAVWNGAGYIIVAVALVLAGVLLLRSSLVLKRGDSNAH